MPFIVRSTANFDTKLKDAISWLHFHYAKEYTEEVADRRIGEFKAELIQLISNIRRTPKMFVASEARQMGTHLKAIHGGRFQVVWVIDERNSVVQMIDFQDLRYPEDLRYADIFFEDEE